MLKKINLKIESMNKKQELAAVIILSSLLILGVTVGVGTLTCGWHLVDDHQFLKIIYDRKFESKTLYQLFAELITSDLNMRYRPLYYPGRVISSILFGTNLTAHAVWRSIEIIVACIFLYYCGQLMGAGKVHSFLFAAISLTGYQSVVWWKLGPQEALGTTIFAVGFFCMLKWLRKNRMGWALGSLAAILFICNYKESYILLIPFMMMYVLYDDIMQQGGQVSWHGIWKSIRDRFWYNLVLLLVFIISICIIVFSVGMNNYDKVGLDASVSLGVYVEALTGALQSDLKWYTRFGIVFILILLTYWEDLKRLWKEILLVAVFLLPQFVLYGQSGINERYILPSSIGYALFFMIFVPKKNFLAGGRKGLYQLSILLLLLAHTRVAMREADYYRYRGESVTTMLETVRDMTREKEEIKILSCFSPNAEGNLTIDYWMKLYEYNNVYYWSEDKMIINQVCDTDRLKEEQLQEQPFEDMDVVVMYNQEDRHWCYTPTLELSDFTYQKCGTLDIYVRNNSGITPIDTTVEGLKINF